MAGKLAKFWAYLAVILPTLISLMLIFNSTSFIPAEATVSELAKTLAFRNLALTAVLLYSILTKQWRLTGYLMVVRGLSDMGDFFGSLTSGMQLTPMLVSPLIGSFITLIAAKYLIKSGQKE